MDNLTAFKLEEPVRYPYGTQLRRVPLEPMPESFRKRVKEIKGAGKAFGEVALTMTLGDVVAESKNWLLRLEIPAIGPDVGTWDYAARAIFWFEAYLHTVLHSERHVNIAQFGGRTQRDLTRAQLGMCLRDRKRFFRYMAGRGVHSLEWRRSYNGAMSVARTIYQLQALGLIVILPMLHIDMYQKVDLICLRGHDTYTFQVKSHQDIDQTDCRKLLQPYDQEDLPHVLGMKKFGTDYRLNTIPVLLTLGNDGRDQPWESDTTLYLQEQLKKLFVR